MNCRPPDPIEQPGFFDAPVNGSPAATQADLEIGSAGNWLS